MHNLWICLPPSPLDDTGGFSDAMVAHVIGEALRAAGVEAENRTTFLRIEFEVNDLKRALDVVLTVLKEDDARPGSIIRVDFLEAYRLDDDGQWERVGRS